MKYIVQSTVVWDRISFPGSSDAMEAPGGAGFYALAGMKVWEDDVGIVSGIGADYLPKFGDWYRENHLPTEGLLVKDPHSPQTLVQYAPDGERTERPVFGEAHYHSIEATPQELAPFCQDAAGIYVFKNLDPSYWEGLLPLKEKYGFHLMWEIAADAAVSEHYHAVKKLAEQTSVFSINRTEALQLTQAASLEAAIAVLQDWAPDGVTALYRHYTGTEPRNRYVFCWEGRLAEVHYWGDDPTQAQLELTAAALCPEALELP